LTDHPGLGGTAARLANCPEIQNGAPDWSALAVGAKANDAARTAGAIDAW
jgi:hypothetical protein